MKKLLKWLLNGSSAKDRMSRRPDRSLALRVEELESRMVPSVNTVNTALGNPEVFGIGLDSQVYAQILGANGYTKIFPLVHRYAEVRGGSIYGGTLQIHKNMIAREILGRPAGQKRN